MNATIPHAEVIDGETVFSFEHCTDGAGPRDTELEMANRKKDAADRLMEEDIREAVQKLATKGWVKIGGQNE